MCVINTSMQKKCNACIKYEAKEKHCKLRKVWFVVVCNANWYNKRLKTSFRNRKNKHLSGIIRHRSLIRPQRPKHPRLLLVCLEFDSLFYVYCCVVNQQVLAYYTSDNRINGARTDISLRRFLQRLQPCAALEGIWFLSDVSEGSAGDRWGFLHLDCIKRTQYDMFFCFFFFDAKGSFLYARHKRVVREAGGVKVLYGKPPSGSV